MAQSNIQIATRFLVTDLAIIMRIVFCTFGIIWLGCRYLYIVQSNGVASVGEGEGVNTLFQGDQG